MPAGLVCTIGYAIILLHQRPYRLKGDDRLRLLVQAVMFIMLTTGNTLVSTDTNVLEPKLDLLLSLLLIVLTCALMLVFLVQAGNKIKKAVVKQVAVWRKSWLHVQEASSGQLVPNTTEKKESPKPVDDGTKLSLPVTNPLHRGASELTPRGPEAGALPVTNPLHRGSELTPRGETAPQVGELPVRLSRGASVGGARLSALEMRFSSPDVLPPAASALPPAVYALPPVVSAMPIAAPAVPVAEPIAAPAPPAGESIMAPPINDGDPLPPPAS